MGIIVLGVVALGYFAFTRIWGGNGCGDDYYCVSGNDIPPPDGYERVSDIYEYNAKKAAVAPGTDVGIQVALKKPTVDARNLSFYRYLPQTKTWEPIAPAVLDPQGRQVSATLHDTPQVMAVLRRLSAAGHVVAYLAHNATLHKEAVGRITILHTLDFTPAADGTIQGDLTSVKVDPSFAFYPVISANAGMKGSIQVVSGLLSNAQTRSAHVQQIAKKVADNQLAGIDIAYLDLPATERTSFTLFVAELAQVLHNQNRLLTLSLPPPIKVQDRIDEGAYDWAELGKAADVLQIAPYRDQSTYRLAMPEVLQHLANVVQPSKLVLTITPYATEKAQEGIRTLSLVDAMNIAGKLKIASTDARLTTNSNVEVVGVNIDKKSNLTGVFWQPETATVTFTYQQGGGRTVWIENFFSVGFKLEFITRYKLGGVGVEDASDNIMLGNVWTALVPFITSGQPILLQPNAKDLQPQWKASRGGLEDSLRGSAKWLTPAEPGTYTVNLTLSDGVSLFESEIVVNVQDKDRTPAPGTPAASPTPVG